jgi:hypothetical protein
MLLRRQVGVLVRCGRLGEGQSDHGGDYQQDLQIKSNIHVNLVQATYK